MKEAAHGVRKEAAPGAIFTCPMHPEVRQTESGNCPKCGMALEPAGAPAPSLFHFLLEAPARKSYAKEQKTEKDGWNKQKGFK
ncbi:MAG: hypothetical protein M0P73_12485 [Syntrophobacterales bacterium]|nr:hypothetical protein [Syntrophobacterales bacterium]